MYALASAILSLLSGTASFAQDAPINVSGFGLPGHVDLPSGGSLPDGELVLSYQLHENLSRSTVSFQLLPRVGMTFRYSGHGSGGSEAFGRVNHDRSFDIHAEVLTETNLRPSVAIGMRDFIGTGWYSSEYVAASKTFGKLDVTAGLGFGRLAGRNAISNPLTFIDDSFADRSDRDYGKGGTLSGVKQWFHGDASPFFGLNYRANDRVTLSAEYSPDLMEWENARYGLEVNSPYNFGLSYAPNDRTRWGLQYLHGSTIAASATFMLNPSRPPNGPGNEGAPVPMRVRGLASESPVQNQPDAITASLAANGLELINLAFEGSHVTLEIENTRYRSAAQALGRAIAILQRFSSDEISRATIVFVEAGIAASAYEVDLDQIAEHQFGVAQFEEFQQVVSPKDVQSLINMPRAEEPFTFSFAPYFQHRLFDPERPFMADIGLEGVMSYEFSDALSLQGTARASVWNNWRNPPRASDSILPHVVTDYPLYDLGGQDGHIADLTLTYNTKLSPSVYASARVGLLEPFFAGVSGEILYKPASSDFAIGVDVNAVRQRGYDMLFDMRDYSTLTGHLNLYFDNGGPVELQVNAGRFLAGDWGVKTQVSRRFNNGWKVGAYATFTDVPFDEFGEGSFDKAVFIEIPIDWLKGQPSRDYRSMVLQPISRDGGAVLTSGKRLFDQIKDLQGSEIERGYARTWK